MTKSTTIGTDAPRALRLVDDPTSDAQDREACLEVWHTAIQEWRTWLAAIGRPKTTIRLRTYQVQRFADWHHRHPWRVTPQQIAEWLVSREWSPETIRSHRAALVQFYTWGIAAGHTRKNPAAMVPAVRPGVHLPRPAPEAAVAEAIMRADERTRLMIALGARQGLRRAEIARVRTDDVVRDLTGYSLRVHGKGNRERLIPLADDLAAEIMRHPAGFVFPGNDDGHLSPPWVGKLISRVLPEPWTTHTLRHRFATMTYSGSHDLLAVQALLGHSKPETTRGYVQLPDDSLRAALRFAS